MRTILLICIGLSVMLSAEFTREANGIVTDSTTGLVWQDDAVDSQMSWQSAITHCEALSLGGHEDWRLPNIKELTSLVDDTKYGPSINDIFESKVSSFYWSSTTNADNSANAWYVLFRRGGRHHSTKDYGYYVRCVRAGE